MLGAIAKSNGAFFRSLQKNLVQAKHLTRISSHVLSAKKQGLSDNKNIRHLSSGQVKLQSINPVSTSHPVDEFLQKLSQSHAHFCAHSKVIDQLLLDAGETNILNDHFALRTFDHSSVGLKVFENKLAQFGYYPKGEYRINELSIFAKHYETEHAHHPKIFVSQFILDTLPRELRNLIIHRIESTSQSIIESDEFILNGRPWKPIAHAEYKALQQVSEYAAWVMAHGYRPNHKTISVDRLQQFPKIELLIDYVKQQGFIFNSQGGVIKGKPEEGLLQASTLAEKVLVHFADVQKEIPGGFVEYAERPVINGTRNEGFIANNARDIFSTTNELIPMK